MIIFMRLPDVLQHIYYKEKSLMLIHSKYCLENYEGRCPISLESAFVVCSDDHRRPETCPNREIDFDKVFNPGFREFWENARREVSLT